MKRADLFDDAQKFYSIKSAEVDLWQRLRTGATIKIVKLASGKWQVKIGQYAATSDSYLDAIHEILCEMEVDDRLSSDPGW